MYCPQCRGEFVESITHCEKCDVDLVQELPEISHTDNPHRLKYAARIAVVGAMTIFTMYALSTFIPSLFRLIPVQVVSPFLHAIAYGTILFFYVFFYFEYTKDKPDMVGKLTLLPIVSSGSMCLINIWLALRRFGISVSDSYDPRLHWTSEWLLAVPALASLANVIFFAALQRSLGVDSEVKEASRYAFFGAALWFLTFCAGLIRGHLLGSASLPLYLQYLIVGLSLIASAVLAVTVANFMVRFQKEPAPEPFQAPS